MDWNKSCWVLFIRGQQKKEGPMKRQNISWTRSWMSKSTERLSENSQFWLWLKGLIKFCYLNQLLASWFPQENKKLILWAFKGKNSSKIVKFCKCIQVLGTFYYAELVKNLTNGARTVTAYLAHVGWEILFIGSICHGRLWNMR